MTQSFETPQAPSFNSALKGEATQRQDTVGSLISRRTMRRDRRANRAL